MLLGAKVVSLTQRLGGRSPVRAEHTEAHPRHTGGAEGRCEPAKVKLQGGIHQTTARRAERRSRSSGDCFRK